MFAKKKKKEKKLNAAPIFAFSNRKYRFAP
jgi:hypothetical protein